MKKLTKREYAKRMAELTARKADAEWQVSQALAAIVGPVSEDEADRINFLHDKVYEWQQAIEALDFAWNTRDFNSSDWTMYRLIQQNID